MCLLLIQAATLFFALATASLLSTPSPSPGAKDITTVAGTTGPDYLSIHFRAPCPGCSEDLADGLELTLEIDSAEEECSNRSPRLNGQPLIASNHGNGVASGQIFLQSKPSDGSGVRDVNASWESTCLNGEASIVSVRLQGVAGEEPFKDTSGFTTSFKQKGQPTMLRLQDKPVDQLSQILCGEWLVSDDESLSITPLLLAAESPLDTLLQAEYAKLAQLQAEMDELHERVRSTLRDIVSLLKQEFKACSSMKCIWDTAVNEVSPIAKLVASQFNHHKNLISGCGEGDAQSPCSSGTQDKNSKDDDFLETDNSHDELDGPHVEKLVTTSTKPSEPPTQPSPPSQPTTRAPTPPSPSSSIQVSPASTAAHHSVSSATSPHVLPYGQTSDEYFALQRKLGLAIIALVLLVILSGLAIRAIVKFRDPRRRAERAARREERHTKRLYAKAACKHKWRTWWRSLSFRKQDTEDYEEKRQTILEQEGILDDDDSGLQKEIRTMQNASDFVRDLVQAEEGRARRDQAHHYRDGFEPAELDGGVGSSRSSDIAPSYKTHVPPPPRYEEELEGEMVVIEGFRYTPSATDDTPESSIVDCSPRLSLETGRSTIITKDTQD